jgi:hypothetical protein
MPDLTGALAGGIGSLRWLVTFYRRDQAPDAGVAIEETLVPLATVHADVQPAGSITWVWSTQIDGPITHLINVRWQDYPTNAEVVVRSTNRPDGTQRSELFRIRRVKELQGRKRFIQLECEQEHSRTTPDDSDETRNDLLTEPYDGVGAAS